MQCPTELFSLHLQNTVHEAPCILCLQPQVTVYICGSVTIHLLCINTEFTEFQPNSTVFELVPGADIRFEQIKTVI